MNRATSVAVLNNPVPSLMIALMLKWFALIAFYTVDFKEHAEVEGTHRDHQVQLSPAQDIPKSQAVYLFLSTVLSVFSTLHHPSLHCT